MARLKKYEQTSGTKVIVQYKNRKLYDTVESEYINVSDLLTMPEGSFMVVDKETGNTITDKMVISALAGHYMANPAAFSEVKTDLLAKLTPKVQI